MYLAARQSLQTPDATFVHVDRAWQLVCARQACTTRASRQQRTTDAAHICAALCAAEGSVAAGAAAQPVERPLHGEPVCA